MGVDGIWCPPLNLLFEETALTTFTVDASAALGGPDWLARHRHDAWDRFSASNLPTESEEVWRYSGIDAFDLEAFAPDLPVKPTPGAPESALDEARRAAHRLGTRSGLVVTLHGAVVGVDIDPEVVATGSMAVTFGRDISSSDGPPSGLGELFVGEDGFAELHNAFLADVVVVSVPPKAVVRDPLVIVHLVEAKSTGLKGGPGVFPRTLVRVGTSASGEVIELVVSRAANGASGSEVAKVGDDPPRALVVPVAELDIADDARLSYANVQLLDAHCSHIGTQVSRVGRDATLRSLTVGLGGSYARVRTDSAIVGPGGTTSLWAAYLGTGAQVHDFRTKQDHRAARTRSELLFKGAVADQARSVYSGLIRIRHGARGSDARQTNHNLVLSEGAHADSVPNLDIDENDVRCSHASTVGPIDEAQRYYLESRGIEPAVAERLIVRGFFSDLAGRSPFAGVGQMLEDVVGARLDGRLPAEVANG